MQGLAQIEERIGGRHRRLRSPLGPLSLNFALLREANREGKMEETDFRGEIYSMNNLKIHQLYDVKISRGVIVLILVENPSLILL